MAVRTDDARQKLLADACGYVRAEKGDETDAYFNAQLELCEDQLDQAILEYAGAKGLLSEPLLGLATTRQLLQELSARFNVANLVLPQEIVDDFAVTLPSATLDYRTVDQ